MDIYEEIRRNLLGGKADEVVNLIRKAIAVCYPCLLYTSGLDEKTGIIIEEANSEFGAYIGGKILILPCAKGSNGWASHFYSASVAGHKPIACVIEKLDSRCAACIVELGIPSVVETETEACKIRHDGDYIRSLIHIYKGLL